MKKYALPQRLADMEHVLASELADHLDDYLDRCNADNIGFIVDTDKSPMSYVPPGGSITPATMTSVSLSMRLCGMLLVGIPTYPLQSLLLSANT